MNDELIDKIRQRIVLLDYRPGEVLAPNEIASEYSVSVTPVREALIRLETEGLVRRLPSRSLQVAEVGLIGIKGLFEVKLLLNRLTGQLAARRISEEEIDQLKALYSHLKAATERRDLLVIDEEMHKLISKATRNVELTQITLRQRYHITRLWHYVQEHTTYEDTMVSDFGKLIPALERRDEETCARILWQHLESFMPVIQGVLTVH